MNFLTHLFFSNDSIDNTTGILIGNSANAKYYSKYDLEILKGIAMDMQIRVFSETHPAFHRSVQRVSAKYSSKYATFVVNVFYDHLLAKNWDKYSKEGLESFSEKTYKLLEDKMTFFPYKIRKFAPEMISKKWIVGASSIEGTHRYIKLLTKTERFTTNLDQCLFELIENYQQYNSDFDEYFTALCEYMTEESRKFETATAENQLFLLSA